MAANSNGYQAISIYGASIAGPFEVDMGVKGRRPLSFPTLARARAFVEGFDADALSAAIQADQGLAIMQRSHIVSRMLGLFAGLCIFNACWMHGSHGRKDRPYRGRSWTKATNRSSIGLCFQPDGA
jgi:hypothetical protein